MMDRLPLLLLIYFLVHSVQGTTNEDDWLDIFRDTPTRSSLVASDPDPATLNSTLNSTPMSSAADSSSPKPEGLSIQFIIILVIFLVLIASVCVIIAHLNRRADRSRSLHSSTTDLLPTNPWHIDPHPTDHNDFYIDPAYCDTLPRYESYKEPPRYWDILRILRKATSRSLRSVGTVGTAETVDEMRSSSVLIHGDDDGGVARTNSKNSVSGHTVRYPNVPTVVESAMIPDSLTSLPDTRDTQTEDYVAPEPTSRLPPSYSASRRANELLVHGHGGRSD